MSLRIGARVTNKQLGPAITGIIVDKFWGINFAENNTSDNSSWNEAYPDWEYNYIYNVKLDKPTQPFSLLQAKILGYTVWEWMTYPKVGNMAFPAQDLIPLY